MTLFKNTKTVWISEDWVKSMFQDHINYLSPLIYFVQPPAGKIVKPIKYKLTLEQIN